MSAGSRIGGAMLFAGLAVGVVVAQQTGRAPIDMATASPQVMSAVARANAAVQDLQATLVARLTSEMEQGGPTAAVRVCRDEAQTLTEKVAVRHGVTMGRTSDRVRNPANAPRAWAASTVASHAGRKVADVQPVAFDLGGRVGMLRPIGTMAMCVTCHGPREGVDAVIGGVLRTAYPQDQAVGFAAGDLRGWFWVEADVVAVR